MAAGKKSGKKSQASNDFLEPLAPTGVAGTDVGTNRAYNDGAATVSFSLPALSPAATSYTVTASTGQTATGSSSPITVSGLPSDTSVTFTVTATNAAGISQASSASSAITITTVPATPSAPTATAGVDQDTVSWTAPSNGGKAITGYTWASSDSKSGSTAGTSVAVTQEGSTSQTYTVYATNANGNSQTSASSNSVTTTPPFFPPFFPPYFPYFPFFPPFFPPYFPFFPPFFPPYFPFFPFFPPFFPPYFPFFPPFFPSFIIPWFGPPCVEENTLIDTPNGQIPVKNLQVGDVIWSTPISELDPSEPDWQKYAWSANQLTTGALVETTITAIEAVEESDIICFNGNSDIRLTFTQPVFVKTVNNQYKIKEAYYVEVGESLIVVDSTGQKVEVPVTSIEHFTDEVVNVYQLSCEPYDWFFVSGILVHNK